MTGTLTVGSLCTGAVGLEMGLRDGWVTGIDGLTRAQQAQLIGNAVVPQQATYALGVLAGRYSAEEVAS